MTTTRRHRVRLRREMAQAGLREPAPEQQAEEAQEQPLDQPEQAENSTNGHQSDQPSPLRQALWNPVLTVEEVAMLLRVSPQIVLKLTSAGDLLSFKVHNEIRVMRIDIYRFLIEQRQKPTILRKYKESEREEREIS